MVSITLFIKLIVKAVNYERCISALTYSLQLETRNFVSEREILQTCVNLIYVVYDESKIK